MSKLIKNEAVDIRTSENGYLVTTNNPMSARAQKLSFESKKSLLKFIDSHFDEAKPIKWKSSEE